MCGVNGWTLMGNRLEKRGKKLFAKRWAKRLVSSIVCVFHPLRQMTYLCQHFASHHMTRFIEVDTQFLSIYKSTEDRRPKHLPIRMITAKVGLRPFSCPHVCHFTTTCVTSLPRYTPNTSILPVTQSLTGPIPLSLRCALYQMCVQ